MMSHFDEITSSVHINYGFLQYLREPSLSKLLMLLSEI